MTDYITLEGARKILVEKYGICVTKMTLWRWAKKGRRWPKRCKLWTIMDKNGTLITTEKRLDEFVSVLRWAEQ